MLEKTVEAYLVERVRALGGTAYKFTSPARASVPDRIVVLPPGRIFFVEVKRPGGKLTRGQEREHEHLRRLGADVRVLDSIGAINAFLNEVQAVAADGAATDDLLETIDLKAEAGLCAMTHSGTRAFLKDIREIVKTARGAVSPATDDRICTLIPLSDRHPVTDDHPRVIVFTDGSDFNGAQFFDVSADSLNECFYESPDEQPDVSRHATHWMPRPSLRHAAPATADERSTQPAGPADQAVYDAIAQNYQSGLMATAGERAAQSEPSEIEQVIACLGDDAAKLREANPDDEMADNMDAAARMLFEQGDIVERCAKIADSYKCGSCGLDGWIGAAIRASQAAAPAEAREPECPRCNGSGEAVAYTDNGPDATEETVNCPHCNGHGTLAEAYAGVVAALEKANNEYLALCGKQYFAPADAGKAVAWICSGSNDFAPIVRDRDAALRLSQAHGDGKIVALGIVPDVVSQGAQGGKGGDRG
ncbi:hypothetical protein QZM89_07550 [Burkholderia gladioli]|uniref:hypothetical protein n=1 Tax=Burkholderia gladioli TaxID=28095 RepID=UPI002655A892|nr:hypothetical protein [Burkholderia gladioli]MDN7495037.1 hypothetical protein [Burkholderia gladioli]